MSSSISPSPSPERYLVVSSLDFLAYPLVSTLASECHIDVDDLLFLSICGVSTLDVSGECQKLGVNFANINTKKSSSLFKSMIVDFKPTTILCIGKGAEKEVGKTVTSILINLNTSDVNNNVVIEVPTILKLDLVSSSLILNSLPEGTDAPPYPEFEPIWNASRECRLRWIPIGTLNSNRNTENNSESDSEVVTEVSTNILVSPADTAIALRYKCQREISNLLSRYYSLSVEEKGKFKEGQNLNNSDIASDTVTDNKTPNLLLSPSTFTLDQAEAYIRGCTFPLYDPPYVKSEIEETNTDSEVLYYIDTFEHWLHYLGKVAEASGDHLSSHESEIDSIRRNQHANGGLSSIAHTSTSATATASAAGAGGSKNPNKASTSSTYSADTHWYSNVGGSIVKISAETMKLRQKKSENKTTSALSLIPGQALSQNAKKRLRMNEPLIGLTAQTYISRALTSGWIGVEGPHIKQFEAAISRVCGVQSAVAVQSGTAALYGSMKALGVSDNSHHVIVPSYTCAACADAIVHANGVPIAVDCELDSYGLDYESVKRAIESDENNIVGVVIAPCYGVPSRDHLKIWELCKNLGLWLCEDNCESYGAKMDISYNDDGSKEGVNIEVDQHGWLNYISDNNTNNGNPTTDSNNTNRILNQNLHLASVGSMSTMSVVSVRSEKMVGVGEGGAILSNDVALVSKARWWCSRAPVRGCGLWRVYEHESIGQNYRLPELLGAVGLAAVENLPVMIQRKRMIHEWYRKYLMEEDEELSKFLVLQKPKMRDQPVWWLNALKIDIKRLPQHVQENINMKIQNSQSVGVNGGPGGRKIFNLAESVGLLLMQKYPHIEIRPAFFPLHIMSTFSKFAQPCPNCDDVYNTLLCVPSSAHLEEVDVKEVCMALRESFKEALGY